ncbi:MAG: hypothetical protein IH948_08165 [Bacteroidetes bacterium]|nr:hypothetical protein [Bacteroidota bacterium]
MQEDVIFSIEREPDHIILHDKYQFQAYISIGLKKNGDYMIKLEFHEIDEKSYKDLIYLGELPWRLDLNSEIIKRHQYEIPQLLVIKADNSSINSCVWECLSENIKTVA